MKENLLYASESKMSDENYLHTCLLIAKQNNERATWEKDSPGDVIKKLIDDIPGTIDSYLVDKRSVSKKITSRGPSPLEQYFAYKAFTHDPGVADFEYSTKEVPFTLQGALMCLRDGIRTKKFATSIQASIRKLEKTRDTVLVVDAGSGPVPILGIIAALASSKVYCTCIEQNPHSVAFAQTVIRSLGLEKQITIVEANAKKYTPKQNIDLLISETMDSGIAAEDIRAILNNLRYLLSPTGITIPSKIQSFATSISLEDYLANQSFTYFYKFASPYIPNLNWTNTGTYVPHHVGRKDLPRIFGKMPGSQSQNEGRVAIMSSRVFLPGEHEDIVLDCGESMITDMRTLADGVDKKGFVIPHVFRTKPGTELIISYKPGDLPEVLYERQTIPDRIKNCIQRWLART